MDGGPTWTEDMGSGASNGQVVSRDICKKSLDAYATESCMNISPSKTPSADVKLAGPTMLELYDGKEVPVVQIFGVTVTWNIAGVETMSVTTDKFFDHREHWYGKGTPVSPPFILDRQWMTGARQWNNRLFLRLDLMDGNSLLNGRTFMDSIYQQFSVFGSVAEKLVKSKRRCHFNSCANEIYTEDELKTHYIRMHCLCRTCGKVFATQLGLDRHNRKCTSGASLPKPLMSAIEAAKFMTSEATETLGPGRASGYGPSLSGDPLAAADISDTRGGGASIVSETRVTLAPSSDRLLNAVKHLMTVDLQHSEGGAPVKRAHGFDSTKLYSDLSRAIFRNKLPAKLKVPQNSIMARLNENTPGHGYADLFTGVLDSFRRNYPLPSSNRQSLVPWAVDSPQLNEMTSLFTVLFAYIRKKDEEGMVTHLHKMTFFLRGAITMERTAREMGGEYIALQGNLHMMNDKYNILKRAVDEIAKDTSEPETKRRCQLAMDGQDALDPPIVID